MNEQLTVALAVLGDVAAFCRAVRSGAVLERELLESVAQWFDVEWRTAGTRGVALKPTERFVGLLAASGAFQRHGEHVERTAWSQSTDGIYFRGVQVFPGVIVEEAHGAKSGDGAGCEASDGGAR